MENIFSKINYAMFKVLSSKDRIFNFDILSYLYDYFCGQNGGASAIKDDVIVYLEQKTDLSKYKEIDDEADEDIKNKTKREIILAKYIQLKKTGWIEDGYNKDLDIETNLTSAAIKIMDTLIELGNDEEGNEFVGYVFNTYRNLIEINFDEHNSISMIEQAYKSAKELSDNLYSMTSSIKKYTDEILKKDNYNANEIATNIFDEYNDKVGVRLFSNLKTKDNPRRYSKFITDLCEKYLDEKRDFLFVMEDYKIIKRKTNLTIKDYSYIKDKLAFIHNTFSNIEKRIEEIDAKNNNYLKVSEEKIKFIINESKDIEESINDSLKLLASDFDYEEISDFFDLSIIETLDDESFFKPRAKYTRIKDIPLDVIEDTLSDETKEDFLKKIKDSEEYLFDSINNFMLSLLGEKEEISASELPKNLKNLAIRVFLGQIYQFNEKAGYKVIYKKGNIDIDNFTFNDFIIRRK